MEGRLKDIDVGGITNKVINSLEIGGVILHVEVIWDARSSHGG